MAGEWTETLWIVIPIAARDTFARIASTIMPDVNEGVMFDDIRLSANGQEPASYLMSECPCTKELAHEWLKILLPLVTPPQDYPDVPNPDAKDITDTVATRADGKFIAVFTDRIDGQRVKDTKSVRVIDSKYSALRNVSDIQNVLDRVSLSRIPLEPLNPNPRSRGAK